MDELGAVLALTFGVGGIITVGVVAVVQARRRVQQRAANRGQYKHDRVNLP